MLKHQPPKTMTLNETEMKTISEQIKQYGIRNNTISIAPPIDDNYPIRSLYYVKAMEQKQNKNEETKIITIKKIKEIKEKIISNKEELNELKNEDYGLSIV